MAETVDPSPGSDSEPEERVPKKPLAKRRRLLSDRSVPAVPIYSNKVQSSLQLLPDSLELPVQNSVPPSEPQVFDISGDDGNENVKVPQNQVEQETRHQVPSSSPSPPPSPQLRKQRRRAKIFDQKLRNLTSSLSAAKKTLHDDGLGDDVIVIDALEPLASQELVLKVRCRADLYRVPVRMTDPLQCVIEHMGQTLKVHPDRILLLFRDHELAADATPHELGLGVADIVDCVVETASKGTNSASLQLRVQGKDKSSQMEISIQRGEQLEALMRHYCQAQGLDRRKLTFYFDGQRLAETWTPEELGMESGDIIEVWN